ncbi:DctQ2 [Desulforapulum autotrophicum HRM2]|uniref:DctQ2 n=1 Tax=Desulforapulum autotrophicum (strain ATCC 43914 / DSM 3382 / VKM B-1955 / HRM2) TaxID=177437 RepID=C0QK93_DESAH|nr:TRAP transporter small permease [Desulforapulum autotrophicum]ACN13964.1 DctQ2 [Desulforapulum autotrophicum HRM2]
MQRIHDFIDRVENITLVWTIIGLALAGFIQVITRYLFNYSFSWFEELGRYLGVFIAFLGAAIGVKTGSHFTMDLMVTNLKQPWQQRVKGMTSTLSALFFFTVSWYSWKIVLRMYGYATTSPTMQIPMYIAYLPIPVFSIVIGARFLIKAWEFLKQGEAG